MTNNTIDDSEEQKLVEQADELVDKLEVQCDQYEHGGVVILALIRVLSVQLHGMIIANGLDKDLYIERVKSDIDDYMELLEEIEVVEVPTLPNLSNRLN